MKGLHAGDQPPEVSMRFLGDQDLDGQRNGDGSFDGEAFAINEPETEPPPAARRIGRADRSSFVAINRS
jgi:hypothetical protein